MTKSARGVTTPAAFAARECAFLRKSSFHDIGAVCGAKCESAALSLLLQTLLVGKAGANSGKSTIFGGSRGSNSGGIGGCVVLEKNPSVKYQVRQMLV